MKKTAPTHDVVDELKPAINEALIKLETGAIDLKTAWNIIRAELVNAYEFGNDKFESENVDNIIEGVSTSDILEELDKRGIDSHEAKYLERIVIRVLGNSSLIPTNLQEEQKVKLLEFAMQKYSLSELENKLGFR